MLKKRVLLIIFGLFVMGSMTGSIAQSDFASPVLHVEPTDALATPSTTHTEISWLYSFSGCGNRVEVVEEIFRIIGANFGGYSKDDPLKVYVSPFIAWFKWAESEIGRIAWEMTVTVVKDIAHFSDGKVVFVGPKSQGYSSVDEVYMKALQEDGFWDAKDPNIKKRLSDLADRRNANMVVHGIYDGDDTGIDLTVFLYAQKDDVILKERIENIRIGFTMLRSIIEANKNGRNLNKAEEGAQRGLCENLKRLWIKLVREYMEGK